MCRRNITEKSALLLTTKIDRCILLPNSFAILLEHVIFASSHTKATFIESIPLVRRLRNFAKSCRSHREYQLKPLTRKFVNFVNFVWSSRTFFLFRSWPITFSDFASCIQRFHILEAKRVTPSKASKAESDISASVDERVLQPSFVESARNES